MFEIRNNKKWKWNNRKERKMKWNEKIGRNKEGRKWKKDWMKENKGIENWKNVNKRY